MRRLLATLLMAAGLVVIAPAPASAHWGDWHQSSSRSDVWYNQRDADSTAYWHADTPGTGVLVVRDNPWSPNGWGMYDVYTNLRWEGGAFGRVVGPEHDYWNCYAHTGCGWHRVQEFEGGFMYYATWGGNAYRTFIS